MFGCSLQFISHKLILYSVHQDRVILMRRPWSAASTPWEDAPQQVPDGPDLVGATKVWKQNGLDGKEYSALFFVIVVVEWHVVQRICIGVQGYYYVNAVLLNDIFNWHNY